MTMTDDQLPDGWEITQKPKPPAYDRFMAVKGKTQIEAFTWPRLVEFARTQDAIEQAEENQRLAEKARKVLDGEEPSLRDLC